MMLAFFKYGLPVLLGYTLFAGVAGRLNPFALPQNRQERASWYLGIWTGLAVCCVLATGLHMAYDVPSYSTGAILLPAASLLACLLAPALGLYVIYRLRAHKIANIAKNTSFDWTISKEDLHKTSPIDAAESEENQLDAALEGPVQATEITSEVSPAYLESVQIEQIPDKVHGDAMNDSEVKEAETAQSLPSVKTDAEADLVVTLTEEIALRKETEKHLRITRKALSVLEADTRHHSVDKADALIELEEQLASSIESATEFESLAVEEKAKRIEIENNVIELKQKMVEAKKDIRKSAASRAQALSTANKSIAFARQSVQIRARLESELNVAQNSLDKRQKTMSSLIRALEREKRRTQAEVTNIAKQLILKEKQLNARRSLEEVARSVENKLTSRLVKKVAKARPLAPNMNHDEIR